MSAAYRCSVNRWTDTCSRGEYNARIKSYANVRQPSRAHFDVLLMTSAVSRCANKLGVAAKGRHKSQHRYEYVTLLRELLHQVIQLTADYLI